MMKVIPNLKRTNLLVSSKKSFKPEAAGTLTLCSIQDEFHSRTYKNSLNSRLGCKQQEMSQGIIFPIAFTLRLKICYLEDTNVLKIAIFSI